MHQVFERSSRSRSRLCRSNVRANNVYVRLSAFINDFSHFQTWRSLFALYAVHNDCRVSLGRTSKPARGVDTAAVTKKAAFAVWAPALLARSGSLMNQSWLAENAAFSAGLGQGFDSHCCKVCPRTSKTASPMRCGCVELQHSLLIHQSPHRMCDTGVRVPSSSCFSRSATMPGVKRNVAQIKIFIPKARKNVHVVSYALIALPTKHPIRYAMTKSMRRSRAWFDQRKMRGSPRVEI